MPSQLAESTGIAEIPETSLQESGGPGGIGLPDRKSTAAESISYFFLTRAFNLVFSTPVDTGAPAQRWQRPGPSGRTPCRNSRPNWTSATRAPP